MKDGWKGMKPDEDPFYLTETILGLPKNLEKQSFVRGMNSYSDMLSL